MNDEPWKVELFLCYSTKLVSGNVVVVDTQFRFGVEIMLPLPPLTVSIRDKKVRKSSFIVKSGKSI